MINIYLILIVIVLRRCCILVLHHCTQKYTFIWYYIHAPMLPLLPLNCKSWRSQLYWPPLWPNKLIAVLIHSSLPFLLKLQLALPTQFFNEQSRLSPSLNLLLSVLQTLSVCAGQGCCAVDTACTYVGHAASTCLYARSHDTTHAGHMTQQCRSHVTRHMQVTWHTTHAGHMTHQF